MEWNKRKKTEPSKPSVKSRATNEQEEDDGGQKTK